MNGQRGIRTKLLASFGLLLLALGAIGLIGLKNTLDFATAYRELYRDRLQPIVELGHVEESLLGLHVGDLIYLNGDAATRANVRAEETQLTKTIDDQLLLY